MADTDVAHEIREIALEALRKQVLDLIDEIVKPAAEHAEFDVEIPFRSFMKMIEAERLFKEHGFKVSHHNEVYKLRVFWNA
jgi:hypothetical protein